MLSLILAAYNVGPFANGLANNEPGFISILPGAIAELKGRVLPVEAFIELRIDVQPIFDLQQSLQDHIDSVKYLKTRILELPLTNGHREGLLKAIKQLALQITKFANVNSSNSTMDLNLRTPNNHYPPASTSRRNNRNKRGLLNFVGIIENYLFGVVDVGTLNNRLAEYSAKQKTVTSTLNTHTEAIKTLEANVKTLADAVQEYISGAQARELASLDEFAQMSLFILSHSQQISDIQTDATLLQAAIAEAAHGIVTSSLISPRDVHRLLNTIRYKFRINPLFNEQNITLFYSSLSSYLTTTGLSVLLPLQPKFSLTAHKIHPFPHRHNDSFVTLQAPDTILQPTYNDFSPSESTSLAFPTQSIDETCQELAQGLFICLTPRWAYVDNQSSCAHAILNYKHDIYKACKFIEHLPTPNPFTLALHSSTMLYFYENTPVTVKCPKLKEPTLPTKAILGSYALPHECSLKAQHFNLRAIHHFTTDLDLSSQFHIPSIIPPANFSLSPIRPNITIKKLPQLTILPTPPTQGPTFSYGYPVLITFIGIIIHCVIILGILTYLRKAPVPRRPSTNVEINMEELGNDDCEKPPLYPSLNTD